VRDDVLAEVTRVALALAATGPRWFRAFVLLAAGGLALG